MAASAAVAATAVGGTGELVQEGVTGALAAKGDADGLAAAIEAVLADPARAAELGAAGRREAEQKLSLERMAGDLVALYEELSA
jgi:glycosyltransferase involved in cell wall biosynthesis